MVIIIFMLLIRIERQIIQSCQNMLDQINMNRLERNNHVTLKVMHLDYCKVPPSSPSKLQPFYFLGFFSLLRSYYFSHKVSPKVNVAISKASPLTQVHSIVYISRNQGFWESLPKLLVNLTKKIRFPISVNSLGEQGDTKSKVSIKKALMRMHHNTVCTHPLCCVRNTQSENINLKYWTAILSVHSGSLCHLSRQIINSSSGTKKDLKSIRRCKIGCLHTHTHKTHMENKTTQSEQLRRITSGLETKEESQSYNN